jgi:hypothetical protein
MHDLGQLRAFGRMHQLRRRDRLRAELAAHHVPIVARNEHDVAFGQLAGWLTVDLNNATSFGHKVEADHLCRRAEIRPAVLGTYLADDAPWRAEARVQEYPPCQSHHAQGIG